MRLPRSADHRLVQVLSDQIQVRIEDVSVHGQGEGGAPVPEDPLDSSRRGSSSDQRGGCGVTEHVDPDIRESELHQGGLPNCAHEVPVPKRLAFRRREEEGVGCAVDALIEVPLERYGQARWEWQLAHSVCLRRAEHHPSGALGSDEYEREHLPGAINLPLRKIETEARRQLDPTRPVVVYCWDSA